MVTQGTHARHRTAPGIATAIVFVVAATAAAAPPDVAVIVSRMKQALEPTQSSLRKMTLTVAQQGTSSTVVLGQARGKLADGNRILTVVLEPPDLRGTAYLVQEAPASDDNKQWAWVPAIGRVRTLISPEAFSAFLNSDFTYSDIGFIPLHSTYSLLGEETKGVHAYKIQAVPAQQWYYARIVSTVGADSFLPIERQFYDPANALWKTERFEGVSTINGVPTVLTTSMDDVQFGSKTTLHVTDLQYGAQIPDALLKPEGLPEAVKSPLWKQLNAPVGN
ncbi:MAG: outer membrane lipoprotein-sorting protein [Candidatus Binatia bacterium]